MYTIYVSLCTGRLLGALCQSSRAHLTHAVAREYVDATDEHGPRFRQRTRMYGDVYVHTFL
jgi:hypothetical protein